MSHLDTLLQARLTGRRQQGSFWSSSARGILVIAALNIVLLWSVTGGVIWQSYRDAADDWKRTAANFSLTTAAYAQQTLVATDLMLRSMLDWIADEDITSETLFTDVMKQRRFHEAIRDRLSACLRSALPRSSASRAISSALRATGRRHRSISASARPSWPRSARTARRCRSAAPCPT